jgi:enoyl-CoA hydratase/carnithine racemase
MKTEKGTRGKGSQGLIDREPQAITYAPSQAGITVISINRPARRNAVDNPTAHKLFHAFRRFENDSSQKICIFHGEGGTFCAGADLSAIQPLINTSDSTKYSNNGNGNESSRSASIGNNARAEAERIQPVDPATIRSVPGPMGPSRLIIRKPVICAITGYAVAGGLELSLLADLRIAETDAVMGVFCRRFGVPLIDGGTVRLPAIIGLGRAMDMVLTGRAVGADEALSWGLVNRVVEKGTAVDEAWKMARTLVRFPQRCMNADRESVYYAVYEAKSLEDALARESRNGVDVVNEEGVQGAKRFREGVGRHGRFEDEVVDKSKL